MAIPSMAYRGAFWLSDPATLHTWMEGLAKAYESYSQQPHTYRVAHAFADYALGVWEE